MQVRLVQAEAVSPGPSERLLQTSFETKEKYIFSAHTKNKSGIPAPEIDYCYIYTVSRVEGMGNTVTSGFNVPTIVPLAERSDQGSVREKLTHIVFGCALQDERERE